ncbi:hypothetical protein SDC9_37452 [bioreactor metagenome]|uniref:Phage protein n=1 Tax=bioreactor metagenome TaxID=1076179 RepID=A0A644VJ13_9ZZZZ|nr:hypothetical protein [Acidaminococcaceae bacterium]
MKNTLGDLNNHLFEQLERLNDEDLKGEALETEITRSKAITDVACRIIENNTLVLKAMIAKAEVLPCNSNLPKQLEGSNS